MKGVAVATTKTQVVLQNVYIDDVKEVPAAGDRKRRVTGKIVQLDAANVKQWNVLFTTWDNCDKVLDIAKDPSQRYAVSGYLKSSTDQSGKWYTNFIIESVV